MKVAMLTPYAPCPPNSGGRIRIWEQIRHLARRHEVTLVSFYESDEEHAHRHQLDPHCRRVILVRRPRRPAATGPGVPQQLADLFAWYTTPEMTAALRALRRERFDVVLLHHIYMAQYRDWLSGCPVLQEQNIESEIFRQVAERDAATPDRARTFRRSRWLLLRRYEDETWPRFPLRLVVSEPDRRELDGRCRTGRTAVVENGVDTQAVAPVRPGSARRLLFLGSLDYYPNVDALRYLAEAILPRLRRRDPGVALVIAGRHPSPDIVALGATPGIQVIPDPADVAPVAAGCRVSIVPQRIASGTRLRILHSMALGLPVVSTSRGCEGLAVADGRSILIRDDPDGFVTAILELLDRPELAARLGAAGRDLVVARYDWTRLLDGMEAELEAAARVHAG